jgi:ubiquinol-cytochrome c reductase cytochrome c subunit
MRRRLLLLAALVCAGLAVVELALADEGGRPPSGAAPALATTSGSPLIARGRALFESSCAACHGLGLRGIPGRGPSLRGAGALAADFYLQTGRMPLPSSRAQPMRTKPAFSQRDIRALVAYVGSFGGPPVPSVSPAAGSLPDGQRLFAMDCAGCHTIQGQGGIVTGATVPTVNNASPRQVAEAIRIGPYVMPRFGPGELSDGQIDSIARYIHSVQHPEDRGGWGLGRIGPIPEGMVAWLLAAVVLLVIARLIGERRDSDPPAPRGPRA